MTCRTAAAALAYLLLTTGGAAAAAVPSLPQDVLSYSQVRPGMTGVGRTVFQGEKSETFTVEILGKLDRIGPGQNLILAKLASPVLATTGVIEGMSGSPIFVDGKMIGAVAYSWGFSREPIAGITPIEEMLAMPEARSASEVATPRPAGAKSQTAGPAIRRPRRGVPRPRMTPSSPLSELRDPQRTAERFDERLARLINAPAVSGPTSRLGLPVAVSGLSRAWLSRRLTSSAGALRLQPEGARPVDAPAAGTGPAARTEELPATGLSAGDAVGAQLVRGDIDFTAIGTVTRVDGDRVLAFGHPFLQLGAVEYPMTRAHVETLLPSLNSSFKIAGPAELVGAFYQDRVSGISGRIGAKPKMVPVHLEIQSASRPTRTYSYEVVADPLLTPILLYLTLGGVLESTEKVAGDSSVELREGSNLLLSGGRKADLSDLYTGSESVLEASSSVGLIAEALLDNEFEQVRIEGANLTIVYSGERRQARITDAWADRSQVRPGEHVAITVGLMPFRDEESFETIDIEIPKELPPGRFTLHVGDARSVTRIEQAGADGLVPLDLDHLLDLINTLRKNRSLGILGTREEPSILIGSDPFPNLPPSKSSIILRRDGRGNFPILRTRVVLDESRPTDYAVEGYRKVELEVVR